MTSVPERHIFEMVRLSCPHRPQYPLVHKYHIVDQSKMIVMPLSGWDLGMVQEILGKAAIGNPIGQWECKRKFMWPLYCKLLVWPKDHMHGPYLWYSGIYLVFYNSCLIAASPQWVHTVCMIIYVMWNWDNFAFGHTYTCSSKRHI